MALQMTQWLLLKQQLLEPQLRSGEQRQHDSDHWFCRRFSLGVREPRDGQAPIHDWVGLPA
jgi:hypothetical protein